MSFGSEMDTKAEINTTFPPHIYPQDEGKKEDESVEMTIQYWK